MTVEFTRRFIRDYKKLSPQLQDSVDKLLENLPNLIKDRQHSGARIKKMINKPGIYEARIDIHFRLTFEKRKKGLLMRRVGTHQIYQKP